MKLGRPCEDRQVWSDTIIKHLSLQRLATSGHKATKDSISCAAVFTFAGGACQTQTVSSLLGIQQQEFDPSGAECTVRGVHTWHTWLVCTHSATCGAVRRGAAHILDVDCSRQTINKECETTTTHVSGTNRHCDTRTGVNILLLHY